MFVKNFLTDIFAYFQFCKNDISKGHGCPAYSFRGSRIQRIRIQCRDCPVTYNSSESYKCK